MLCQSFIGSIMNQATCIRSWLANTKANPFNSISRKVYFGVELRQNQKKLNILSSVLKNATTRDVFVSGHGSMGIFKSLFYQIKHLYFTSNLVEANACGFHFGFGQGVERVKKISLNIENEQQRSYSHAVSPFLNVAHQGLTYNEVPARLFFDNLHPGTLPRLLNKNTTLYSEAALQFSMINRSNITLLVRQIHNDHNISKNSNSISNLGALKMQRQRLDELLKEEKELLKRSKELDKLHTHMKKTERKLLKDIDKLRADEELLNREIKHLKKLNAEFDSDERKRMQREFLDIAVKRCGLWLHYLRNSSIWKRLPDSVRRKIKLRWMLTRKRKRRNR